MRKINVEKISFFPQREFRSRPQGCLPHYCQFLAKSPRAKLFSTDKIVPLSLSITHGAQLGEWRSVVYGALCVETVDNKPLKLALLTILQCCRILIPAHCTLHIFPPRPCCDIWAQSRATPPTRGGHKGPRRFHNHGEIGTQTQRS